VDERNALYPLRGFYLSGKIDTPARQRKPFFRFNSTQVQESLAGTSIRYPQDSMAYA